MNANRKRPVTSRALPRVLVLHANSAIVLPATDRGYGAGVVPVSVAIDELIASLCIGSVAA